MNRDKVGRPKVQRKLHMMSPGVKAKRMKKHDRMYE